MDGNDVVGTYTSDDSSRLVLHDPQRVEVDFWSEPYNRTASPSAIRLRKKKKKKKIIPRSVRENCPLLLKHKGYFDKTLHTHIHMILTRSSPRVYQMPFIIGEAL